MKYKGIGFSERARNRDDIVNEWLKTTPKIKIHYVTQSQNGDMINLSIFYED